MQTNHQKAFTVVELVFVIIIIGILSAIALPKFAESSYLAQTAKASSELAAVRAALSTERQKRILRGDTAAITSLGNVFTNFSAAADGSTPVVLQYPPTACSGQGCWSVSATSYTYTFADSGSATFTLASNKLTCTSGSCSRLE